MVANKEQDVLKINIPVVRAKMSLKNFEKWCKKHGFVGEVEKAYGLLRKKAGLPYKKKAEDKTEG